MVETSTKYLDKFYAFMKLRDIQQLYIPLIIILLIIITLSHLYNHCLQQLLLSSLSKPLFIKKLDLIYAHVYE